MIILPLETNPAEITVNAVKPLTSPALAVMVVVPDARLRARPRLASSLLLLIVATTGAVELQVTVLLRFRVLVSE
jgi:hypothetical protein